HGRKHVACGGATEQWHQGALPIGEDPPQLTSYSQIVRQTADCSEGEPIFHTVRYDRTVFHLLKAMPMAPEPVRTTRLFILKQQRRLVYGDKRLPRNRDAEPADLIFDLRALLNGDGLGSGDAESQPRGRDPRQIVRAFEYGE